MIVGLSIGLTSALPQAQGRPSVFYIQESAYRIKRGPYFCNSGHKPTLGKSLMELLIASEWIIFRTAGKYSEYLGASAIYCRLYALSPIIVPISISFCKPDEGRSYVPIIVYAVFPARVEFVLDSRAGQD